MAPRPDVSETREEQILQAAEAIFIQKGFGNARMEDIANETGLSKGTIYLYFKSKDDLIIATLERVFQRDFQKMDDLDISQMTATEAIWKFVDFATVGASALQRLMPVTYEFLALATRDSVVQQALQQYFRHYMEILLPIVQHGIQAGEFRSTKAEELVIAIGAVFEGVILLWAYDKSIIHPVQHLRSSIQLLLDGIRTPA